MARSREYSHCIIASIRWLARWLDLETLAPNACVSCAECGMAGTARARLHVIRSRGKDDACVVRAGKCLHAGVGRVQIQRELANKY
jgi:hypothetical protein